MRVSYLFRKCKHITKPSLFPSMTIRQFMSQSTPITHSMEVIDPKKDSIRPMYQILNTDGVPYNRSKIISAMKL